MTAQTATGACADGTARHPARPLPQASSTRCRGSPRSRPSRVRARAGASCSTPRRTCQRSRWTCPPCAPTLCPCPSTRRARARRGGPPHAAGAIESACAARRGGREARSSSPVRRLNMRNAQPPRRSLATRRAWARWSCTSTRRRSSTRCGRLSAAAAQRACAWVLPSVLCRSCPCLTRPARRPATARRRSGAAAASRWRRAPTTSTCSSAAPRSAWRTAP